jgi:hypothetical protein
MKLDAMDGDMKTGVNLMLEASDQRSACLVNCPL